MSGGSPPIFREASLLEGAIESTSSFQRGSLYGPAAVASELLSMEPFDTDLGRGFSEPRPFRQVLPERQRLVLEEAIAELRLAAARCLDHGSFVLTLGGEHTVTLGPLAAVVERFGAVGLVQLDAHGDLRDTYEGRKISHACVMRRAVDDLGLSVVGVGIRSICPEEARFVSAHPGQVKHLRPRSLARGDQELVEAIEHLPPLVYLTIDMDAFDPSVAPGVGTPEAGGLSWFQVAHLIDVLATRRTLVGADVVELAPTVERARTVRLAARVALRVLLWSLEVGSLRR